MSESHTGSTTSPIESNALDALIEMVGMDEPDFLIELIDTFLTDAASIVGGMAALWQERDDDSLMRSAHSLKSTSATFQAMPLSNLASDLESEMRDQNNTLDVPSQIQQIETEYVAVDRALRVLRGELVASL